MTSPAPAQFRVLRKSLIPWLASMGTAVLCLVSASADQIFFRNGGKMEGSLLQSNGQILDFKHKAAYSPLPLKRQGIRWILLNQESETPSYMDKVLLTNGDLISCTIQDWEADTLPIQAFNAQSHKIKRENISALYFSMGESLPLINAPQSFVPREVQARPEAPDFFSTQKARLEEKEEPLPDNAAEQIISVDNWAGRATRRWKWLGTTNDHTIEIPAGRGMISKNIGVTERFTLTGAYAGPTPDLRKARIGMAKNCFGVVLLFGGSYAKAAVYMDRNVSNNFYSLELYPDEIVLCRLSDKNGKRKTILLNQAIPLKAGKNASEYSFELQANGTEFKLSINGQPFRSVLDPVEGKVETGQFSILNTEYTPIILKNITLATKLPDEAFSIPPHLNWEKKQPNSGFLFTNDGDILPGSLSRFSMKDKRLEWQIDKDKGVPKSIGFEFISSLVFAPHQDEAILPNVKLHLVSGGRLSGTLLAIDSTNIKLRQNAFGDLTIPRHHVRRIELFDVPTQVLPALETPDNKPAPVKPAETATDAPAAPSPVPVQPSAPDETPVP